MNLKKLLGEPFASLPLLMLLVALLIVGGDVAEAR